MNQITVQKNKFMRLFNCSGEKLIVTKKNESSRSYFKCVGWLFTMILLGGAIAVAVLIGGNAVNKN